MILSNFFFNDTATTEIYTLSLHDALPISIRLVIASLANGMALGHCHDARSAGRDLHRRRMGRHHLFWRGSPRRWAGYSARDFRQRLLHHGDLSAAESHRAVHPADEGNRRK